MTPQIPKIPKIPQANVNPFRASPPPMCVPVERAAWNQEETPMMVTGIVVIGALLVGACSWHLMRRYRSRG